MVYAVPPLNAVPDAAPVPALLNVRLFVVFAVIVPEPPKETLVPLNVTLLLVNEELPIDKPKHLLGIGAPEDLFVGIENAVDTFDCVLASRIARTSAVYTKTGRFNVSNGPHKTEFFPIDDTCDCYTCRNYTRAYLNHLFRAKEMLAATLATIHNERFIVRLVDQIRQSLIAGNYQEFKDDFLGRYDIKSGTGH